MFYSIAQGHGLPHDPFAAIVSPRPVAWISSRDAQGRHNLAPYSFFTAVAYAPPQIVVSSVGRKADRAEGKDSFDNIRQTGVFCVNIAGVADAARLNASSAPYPRETDEFQALGIPVAPCRLIDCPRVADAPAALECRLGRIVDLEGSDNRLVIAEVLAVHLRDDCLTGEGRFDVTRYAPLARLGYLDFGAVEEVFELRRPRL
ncbi:flavin reductase family protein [Pseudogemmobacter sonorensis]|uniref:flavin reductase family protein n=1 Tax=Pseudogemmobacter sonorensis TaxID=2989681 RepID=UPI0036B5278B